MMPNHPSYYSYCLIKYFLAKTTENRFYLQIKCDSPQCVSPCGNDVTRCVSLNVRENPDIVYFGDCCRISNRKKKNKNWENYKKNIIYSRDDRVSNAARLGSLSEAK